MQIHHKTGLKAYLAKFVVYEYQGKPFQHRWMWVICLFQSSEKVLRLVPLPRYQIATIHLPSCMTESKFEHIYYTAVSHTQVDTHHVCRRTNLAILLLNQIFFEIATKAPVTTTALEIKLNLLRNRAGLN